MGSHSVELRPDHGQGQRFTKPPSETAMRCPSYQFTILINGLAAARICVRHIMDFHGDEIPVQPVFTRLDHGVTTNEFALVGLYETVQTGFESIVFNRQFARNQAVGFFNGHRRHRPDAERLDAELGASLHQQIKDRILLLHRVMQFPAEFSDKIYPQGMGGGRPDIDPVPTHRR